MAGSQQLRLIISLAVFGADDVAGQQNRIVCFIHVAERDHPVGIHRGACRVQHGGQLAGDGYRLFQLVARITEHVLAKLDRPAVLRDPFAGINDRIGRAVDVVIRLVQLLMPRKVKGQLAIAKGGIRSSAAAEIERRDRRFGRRPILGRTPLVLANDVVAGAGLFVDAVGCALQEMVKPAKDVNVIVVNDGILAKGRAFQVAGAVRAVPLRAKPDFPVRDVMLGEQATCLLPNGIQDLFYLKSKMEC